MAKEEKVRSLGLKIHKTSHKAVQVDGKSTLKVVGEVHTTFARGSTLLNFSALVVSDLVTDFLAGTNFIIENEVTINMARSWHGGQQATMLILVLGWMVTLL